MTKTDKVVQYYLKVRNVTKTAKKFKIDRATVYSYLYLRGAKQRNKRKK